MKKVSLVILAKERDAALTQLGTLGVLHIEKRSIQSENVQRLLETKQKTEQVLSILRNYRNQGHQGVTEKDLSYQRRQTSPGGAIPVQEVRDRVLSLVEERKSLQEALVMDQKEVSRLEPWGSWNPLDLEYLKEKGIYLILYELPRRVYEKVGETVRLIVLSRDATVVRCVALGDPIPGETPFLIPALSLSELKERIRHRQERLQAIEVELTELARYFPLLEKETERLRQEIEFEMARLSLTTTEDTPEALSISWLCGYVPVDLAGKLKRASAEYGWALIMDDPTETDVPPTLIKNNSFVRIIQPVFDLLGTVPGYREYDISLSFLLFFSLFFAMIMGDAGYGVLLLVVSLWFAFKNKQQKGIVSDGIRLLLLLSSVTIGWGAITGTWFAISYEHLPEFLQNLVIPPFRPNPRLSAKEANRLIQQNIKHLCFIIGTVQLVLAHIKNIKKNLPSLTAVAQLGWLTMVAGLYFLVLNLVLDKNAFPVPPFALWMIGGGLVTYFIFAEQKGGNFFKNILTSVANFLPTFLSAVSSFSDIISYIRLFAVGLAGYAIGESFNSMALGFASPLVRIVAGSLILIAGHGLNLAMSALSVVVHGVRLNMLEYSGHLGMEWSGVKYVPFAVRRQHEHEG
ncbi:MAG: V-type ATP synthase subunit I [Treponemataceae bacterium]|nr:V-type ATP synthase subunit I [Treponemataceae bacterium]